MENLRKIILITSAFPPSWGSGVHRVSKLYKYLPHFGYSPIVLTTDEDSYGIIDHSINYCFKQELIFRLPVVNWRTFSKKIGVKSKASQSIILKKKKKKLKRFAIQFLQFFYYMLSIPDDRVLWIPLAIVWGYWKIRKYRIGLLFSTSPSHCCHIIALILKRLTGLPWIADFRDPWVGNPFNSNSFWLHSFFDNLFESWVVQYSSKIVSISEPIAEELRKRYPNVDLRKFHVLPNSFDPDDFADITETSTPQNKFIISHAGTFYGNRSPASFLQALTKLLDQKPHWRDRIEIFFIGSLPQNGISLDYLNLLKDVVRFVPCLPYQEMLKFLMRSTLLLLIPGPGEGTITGKVFDYLALKKPIFLLSEGNVSLENILRKTKNGIILSYHDVDRIAESLSFFIQEFFRDGTIEMELNEEEIHFFTSIEMARKFSRMMDEILKIDREIHRA